jgi:hypothetical protein
VRTKEHQEKIQQEKLINQSKHKKALLRASAPPYKKVCILYTYVQYFLSFSDR